VSAAAAFMFGLFLGMIGGVFLLCLLLMHGDSDKRAAAAEAAIDTEEEAA
jgi:hypothetical protein